MDNSRIFKSTSHDKYWNMAILLEKSCYQGNTKLLACSNKVYFALANQPRDRTKIMSVKDKSISHFMVLQLQIIFDFLPLLHISLEAGRLLLLSQSLFFFALSHQVFCFAHLLCHLLCILLGCWVGGRLGLLCCWKYFITSLIISIDKIL